MSWPACWQRDTWLTQLLRLFSPLYAILAARAQRRKRGRQQSLPVPVIVVGNLVVGGTGKTPFILWLLTQLKALGHRPGIISRGYGRRTDASLIVEASHLPEQVGDEPLLLAQAGQVPVAVGRDRLAAARALLTQHPELTVLVSDDGLQHLSLPRQLEFCLFDGRVGIGNGRLLPAGPLREPLSRLRSIDAIVAKGSAPALPDWAPAPVLMALALRSPKHLQYPERSLAPGDVEDCVAVCGIGQPESFFQLLRDAGWAFTPMPLADHGQLTAAQHRALSGRTVLLTTKDAVKLRARALPFEAYEVPLAVTFSPADQTRIRQQLTTLAGSDAAVEPSPAH